MGRRMMRGRIAGLAFLAWAVFLGSPAFAAQSLLDQLFTAQEWQAKGNLEAARRSVQEALKAEPKNSYARIRLAQIEAASGNRRGALEILAMLLEEEPDNILALTWQGHLLLAEARPDSAAASYAAVLKTDPGNAWAHLGLGSGLLARGLNQEAAGLLAKAQGLALAPAPSGTQTAGQPRGGLSSTPPGDAHSGGQPGPRYAEDSLLHRALAEAFLALGLAVNARLELERALEASPRDTVSLALAGRAYLALGLEGLALSAWNQALSLDPGAHDARFCLVELLGRQASRAKAEGRREEAVRLWRTALSHDPRDPAALAGLRAFSATKPAAGK